MIQHSASDARLVALLAALHRASGGRTETRGRGYGRYTVYTSNQTHSSVEKACRVAGLGSDALRKLDVDPATMAARPSTCAADRGGPGRGLTPALVVASIGATGTGAIDPVGELGRIAARARRVAARRCRLGRSRRGLPGAALDQRRTGIADSYCTNPHKWLLTNFDCDAIWVADRPRSSAPCRSCRSTCATRRPSPGGDRLPRLARAARPPLPRVEAVGGHPLVWRRRACARTSEATSRWRKSSRPGSRRRPFRARRAASAGARDVPAARRRRRDQR